MKESRIFAVLSVLVFAAFSIAAPPRAFGATPQPIHWTLSASVRDIFPSEGSSGDGTHSCGHSARLARVCDGSEARRSYSRKNHRTSRPSVCTSRRYRRTIANQVYDPNFNMETRFYENEANFSVPLTATKTGSPKLSIDVYYQACNDSLCLPRLPLT